MDVGGAEERPAPVLKHVHDDAVRTQVEVADASLVAEGKGPVLLHKVGAPSHLDIRVFGAHVSPFGAEAAGPSDKKGGSERNNSARAGRQHFGDEGARHGVGAG